jgi:hypothetical protein
MTILQMSKKNTVLFLGQILQVPPEKMGEIGPLVLQTDL